MGYIEIKWNPLKAKLYAKYPEYFHDIGYPFKIEMINVGKEVGDIDFSKLNPYVSLALVAMKFVFNAEKYRPLMDKAMAYFLDPKNKIDSSFIQEVFLYLGKETSSEYREAIMDRPEIMAERKRNGFVSVADVIRAEVRDEERQKAEEEFLQEKLASAREMLQDGDSVEKICRVLKLSEERVRALL